MSCWAAYSFSSSLRSRGYWWRRSPRQTQVFATAAVLLLVGALVGFEAVERLTAGAPAWVSDAGILANAALWSGVLVPVAIGGSRSGDREFETRVVPRP